jgi:hypothetical protein
MSHASSERIVQFLPTTWLEQPTLLNFTATEVDPEVGDGRSFQILLEQVPRRRGVV